MELEHVKLVRTKNKSAYLKHRDIYAKLKPRTKQGKCFGAAVLDKEAPTPAPPIIYNVISTDIWFHIADHIRPEDARTFALICRQTAALVATRKFWRNLYKRYCLQSNPIQMYKLPAHLQVSRIDDSVRARVIGALFYCYPPLLERSYTLDTLLGRAYIASWHQQCQCIWIMCYKFWNQLDSSEIVPVKRFVASKEPVNNWESLATNSNGNHSDEDSDDQSLSTSKFTNPHEGVSLLVICCNRFIPFPEHLLYGQSGSSMARVRLLAARQMLSQDMRASSLELDFVNAISKAVTTVKYPQIIKVKVLPWWHQDFRKFIK